MTVCNEIKIRRAKKKKNLQIKTENFNGIRKANLNSKLNWYFLLLKYFEFLVSEIVAVEITEWL